MGRTTITRRRALALGLGATLAPLLAHAPRARALQRSSTHARSFGFDVGPERFAGRVTPPLAAPARFDLLGVRGAEALAAGAQVRARRRGGAWSAWIALTAHGDHAPDAARSQPASEPVWFGAADELQLRLARRPTRALRVHLVAVPAPTRVQRRRARARAAQAAAPGTPPAIIPRSVWGPDFAPRSAPEYGVVQIAFVHHTVGANEYAPEQSAGIVLGIAKYHRDTNGWNDIGYNFLVDRYGQVFEGRAGGVDLPVAGAQAQGYNSVSTSVAHLGTHSAVAIGEPAMQATAQLLGWKLSLHGVPCEGGIEVVSGGGSQNRYPAGRVVTLQRISGHRDGDATSCPGDALYAQLPELRRRSAALAGPLQPRGQVSVAASEPDVRYGDDAVFAGVVIRSDSTLGAGEEVTLQKVAPSGTWATIARTTANADGSWTLRVPWRRGANVRARAAGVVSRPMAVGVRARLSAYAPDRVREGEVLRMSGRVRPQAPIRVAVALQQRDGSFRYLTTVRARVRKGTWRAAVRLRRAGVYRLTPRAGGTFAAVGDPLFVRAVHRRRLTGGTSAG